MKRPEEHIDAELLEHMFAVEALPHTRAFEHVLYSNRIHRTATHFMSDKPDAPITLSSTVLLGKFPDGMRDIFTELEYSITELQVELVEGESALDVAARMSFYANGELHSLAYSDAETAYTAPDSRGDLVTYSMRKELFRQMLASLVYARQSSLEVDEANNTQRFFSPSFLAKPSIDIPRDAEATLIEQLIMTLGQSDGASAVTTVAAFNLPTGILASRLTRKDTPTECATLSHFDLQDVTGELVTLDQNTVDIHTMSGALERRMAWLYESPLAEGVALDPLDTERPNNLTEWSRLCGRFYTSIQPQLESFAYLDDELIVTEEPL